jgi:predicted O-methyltransferase YrrM
MIERVSVTPLSLNHVMNNHYLSKHETEIVVTLIGSVYPRVVAEFGVNLGKTAKAILDCTPSIETYIGIDVDFCFRTRLQCQRTEVPSAAGLYARDDDRFKLLRLDLGSISLEHDDLEPLDAVFIDGDHSEVGVTADSILARSLLRPGGIIVWHDYGNAAVEVTAALDRFAGEHGWPIRAVEGSWLAFMREVDSR